MSALENICTAFSCNLISCIRYKISSSQIYVDDNSAPCDAYVEGSCTHVSVWNTLHSGSAGPTGTDASRIFAPPLCPYAHATDLVRLDLDTASTPGWNAIDAIAAFGTTSSPTGLVSQSTTSSSNRVVFTPAVGIHGMDYFTFAMSDCEDMSDTAAIVSVIVEPPVGSYFEAFSYTTTADTDHVSFGEATNVTVDLSSIYAKLGEGTVSMKVHDSEFDSVSLSLQNLALFPGDIFRVNLTSTQSSLDLNVVSNQRSRKAIVDSDIAPMTRLELWAYNSIVASGSPTTFRILLKHCTYGYIALISSGSKQQRSSCMSCASIGEKVEAGTMSLTEDDSLNFYHKVCSSAARRAFQCASGQYFNSSELACRPCKRGSFATGTGKRSVCTLCPKAEYAPQESMSECLACDYGTFSDVVGATVCRPCPTGATCNASSLTIDSGRWRSAARPYELYECPISKACLGGRGYGKALCAEGFAGPLCSQCDSNYFLSWCVRIRSSPTCPMTIPCC